MLTPLIFILIILIFGIIDVYFYEKAPYPERSKFCYVLPEGGIAAYFLLRNCRK